MNVWILLISYCCRDRWKYIWKFIIVKSESQTCADLDFRSGKRIMVNWQLEHLQSIHTRTYKVVHMRYTRIRIRWQFNCTVLSLKATSTSGHKRWFICFFAVFHVAVADHMCTRKRNESWCETLCILILWEELRGEYGYIFCPKYTVKGWMYN